VIVVSRCQFADDVLEVVRRISLETETQSVTAPVKLDDVVPSLTPRYCFTVKSQDCLEREFDRVEEEELDWVTQGN
jgi:hypothetical protein